MVMVARLIERRFERFIWKFRLISIVPVVLSLLGSVGCFVIGAVEVFNAFVVIVSMPFSSKSFAAKTIAQMVGGVDYFVIGIALLIFGYGIYELVISDLDPRREGGACTVSKSKFGPGAYCGLFEGNEVDHSDRFPHLICRLQQRTTRPETRAEIQL